MHWYECGCGSYKDESVHKLTEWQTVKNPTDSEEGAKERVCECGYIERSKIDKIERDETTIEGFLGEQTEKIVFFVAIIFGAFVIFTIIKTVIKGKKE